MKRKVSNSRTWISPATTPELFADMPFNLVSETIVVAKPVAPVIQPQLFATAEILSFPPTRIDRHNKENFTNEKSIA